MILFKNAKELLSFDPGIVVCENTINTWFSQANVPIVIMRNMFMIMTLAMMLSTASARTLKSDPCPPGSSPGCGLGCGCFVICVAGDAVGNKAFRTEYNFNHGEQISPFSLTGNAYCSAFTASLYGPDVEIDFFLDGKSVHKGRYQQNYCFWEAGDIHTNDPNADTFKGSYTHDKPGCVLIKSLE